MQALAADPTVGLSWDTAEQTYLALGALAKPADREPRVRGILLEMGREHSRRWYYCCS